MSTRALRAVCLLALLTVTAAACESGPPPPDDRPYEARLLAGRKDKDDLFKNGKQSPIPEAARAAFAGLTYSRSTPRITCLPPSLRIGQGRP